MEPQAAAAAYPESRLVQVRTKILKENDVAARSLRQSFRQVRVYVVSLVSSPGSGKTMFLEKTLAAVARKFRVAALVGDLATDNDARRLARAEVPVRQITTGTTCHLEAEMVRTALADWKLADLDLLFIENVGNLVCPATYDLGENLRLVLFSVTEGEDKPLKYPTIFNTADLAVITKYDLAEAAEFDASAARKNIETVRPGMPILTVSAKREAGMDEWLALSRFARRRFTSVHFLIRHSALPICGKTDGNLSGQNGHRNGRAADDVAVNLCQQGRIGVDLDPAPGELFDRRLILELAAVELGGLDEHLPDGHGLEESDLEAAVVQGHMAAELTYRLPRRPPSRP